jgi:hypothetical protein
VVPTGRLDVENVAFPPAPMLPVPSEVVVPQAAVGHLLKVTVPVGRLGSLLALLAVTVAVKVTECPEADGLGEEVRTVEVASVYRALPEYTKW